jgi:hypothetical protein
VSEASERFVSSGRDVTDDAEARRWARRMREALEAGTVADDSEALRARLAEENAEKHAQQ